MVYMYFGGAPSPIEYNTVWLFPTGGDSDDILFGSAGARTSLPGRAIVLSKQIERSVCY
jgi:hypothetical protein